VHPARPGNTSNMDKSANSAGRFHRSKRFVITFSSGHCQCRRGTRKTPLSSFRGRRGDERRAASEVSQECARRDTGPFRVLAETG
jgi:hypothetical protein